MAEKSRTEYSARNTTVAIAARALAILMGFVGRVVFTHTLSEDYVGINGLFTDILNVLSLSELGVGTAITYALYAPIAEKNTEKQKSLMQLYRRIYTLVALFVLLMGLLIIPFMDVLLKDSPAVDRLILIYLMYLANSVLSYIGVYKRTLVDAHQLSYISVVYQTASWAVQNLLQIVILLTTHNFLLYLSVMILCTVGNNICITVKAGKLYPYLQDKNVTPLPAEERKSIFDNIKAMLMHKVGNVVVNNTDNLLLSSLVGTLVVGCYSNYYLVIGSVRQVLVQAFQGITASVGNLGVKESEERIHKIFTASFFFGQWLYGLMSILLYEVLDTFVGFSFGEKFVMSKEITLVLCINFYLTGMRQATLVFRDTMGLFKYDKYKAIAEAVINLVVSIILGLWLGTIGVFLGTLISTVTTSLWVEPYVLYKYRLKKSSKEYFIKYALYASVTAVLWYVSDLLCRNIAGHPLLVLIARALVVFAVVDAVYLLLYARTEEFTLLWNKGIKILREKFQGKAAEKEDKLNGEEQYLLAVLRSALTNTPVKSGKAAENASVTSGKEQADLLKLTESARSHGVLSLLYDVLLEEGYSERQLAPVQSAAKSAMLQNYRLLFMNKYIVGLLSDNGIRTAVLKGAATASFYAVPELRKSGDLDILLLQPEQTEGACRILESAGFVRNDVQAALHHVVFNSGEGFDIELHTMIAEPFDNNKMNAYMQAVQAGVAESIIDKEIMGVKLPVLSDGYHAFELLLHMLQHFLRSGFGLKLLCDWVIFWSREVDEKEITLYCRLVEEAGIKGFSDLITSACCRYLGLEEKYVSFAKLNNEDVDQFIKEICVAEEFGKSSTDRMVALRGNSFSDYVREFHHQMCLNYPKLGRIWLLWPMLWTITLIRFLRNNRKLRGVSAVAVMKKAGQRGKLLKRIKLFQREK